MSRGPQLLAKEKESFSSLLHRRLNLLITVFISNAKAWISTRHAIIENISKLVHWHLSVHNSGFPIGWRVSLLKRSPSR